MIGIRIGDEFLDVPSNVRVSLQLNNPVLAEDNLSPGSLSMPFELPGGESSPKNAAVLGNPDVQEVPGGTRKFNCELLLHDIRYKAGKLLVREAGGNVITANFNFGLKSLSEEFKTKRVREIISETITIDSASHNKEVYIKPGTAATTPYRITVNGKQYENASLSDLADDITNNTAEPRATAVYFGSGSTPQGLAAPYIRIRPTTGATEPLTPLHVRFDENNGNSGSGFVWQAEGMDLTALNSAFDTFLSGYQTTPYASDKIRFPICFNENMYDEVVQSFKQTTYVNAKNNFGTLKNNCNYGLGINVPFAVLNQNSIQPFLRLKWVLDKVFEFLNVEYEGDWFGTDVDAILIDNAQPLDVAQDYLGGKFVFWKRSFNLADLIEDVTIVEFFKRLQLRYNLSITFNEKTNRIRFSKREAIALQVNDTDITSMCGRPRPAQDDRITGVVLRAPKEDNDALSVVDEISIGTEPEETIEVKLGGLQQEVTTTIAGALGDVTGVNKSQPINTKFGLRFFYYDGLIDNGTFIYPAAGKDSPNYTEQFAGADGLYENFFKYWLKARLNRRTVPLPVNFELVDLLALDWEHLHRFDRKQYLIKSIKVDVSTSGIGVSDVELITMF